MKRAHKIRLVPTAEQEQLLRRAVGSSRFAYNWALAEWRRQYAEGGKPNEAALRRQLNAVKRTKFPWMLDVPKTVVQQAVKNLGAAFSRFFEKLSKYPRFKRRGRHDSARFDNGPGTFEVDGKRIKLPVIGWIKMREEVRFCGRMMSATVSCEAGRWYVSVPVETEVVPIARENQAAVGVDLGVTTLATLSTGEKISGPQALKAGLTKLKRLSRWMSRKVKGSANRRKAQLRLARHHARVAAIRRDVAHKLTTDLVRRFVLVCIENLNVRGMLRNRQLARAVSDIGFYEVRRQLEYKGQWYGSEIVLADRWFPSSKTCSTCSHVLDELPLSVRRWTCPACSAGHDRDVNASINLERYGELHRNYACGEASSGVGSRTGAKLASRKQESNLISIDIV